MGYLHFIVKTWYITTCAIKNEHITFIDRSELKTGITVFLPQYNCNKQMAHLAFAIHHKFIMTYEI